MNIIQGPPRSGKTTRLIELASEHKGIVVCYSQNSADILKSIKIKEARDKIEFIGVPSTARGFYLLKHKRKPVFLDNPERYPVEWVSMFYNSRIKIHTRTQEGPFLSIPQDVISWMNSKSVLKYLIHKLFQKVVGPSSKRSTYG